METKETLKEEFAVAKALQINCLNISEAIIEHLTPEMKEIAKIKVKDLEGEINGKKFEVVMGQFSVPKDKIEEGIKQMALTLNQMNVNTEVQGFLIVSALVELEDKYLIASYPAILKAEQ